MWCRYWSLGTSACVARRCVTNVNRGGSTGITRIAFVALLAFRNPKGKFQITAEILLNNNSGIANRAV